MATIGLSNFHYAILNSDTTSGTTYGTPVHVIGLRSATITPTTSEATLYYDNMAAETFSSLSDISIEIEMGHLTLAEQAALLGHTYADGQMVASKDDVAPYVAIMFEALHGDGSKKLVKLYKGKFAEVTETYNTNGENIEFTSPKITATFVSRISDGKWKAVFDERETGADATIASAWYTSVG